MRKLALIILPIFSILIFSCFKDKLDPITNRDSNLKLEHINFVDLELGKEFAGTLNYQFLVESDTSNILDTIRHTSEFVIDYPIDFSQNFDFNTPPKTKKLMFNLKFRIKGGGRANSVTVSPISYTKNGLRYYNENLDIPGILTRDSIFNSPTYIIDLP